MREKIQVKIFNNSSFELPKYAKEGDSGMDIKANLKEVVNQKIDLFPGERVVVPTGIYVEIPEGYEIQIRPRSGLAAKSGITVLNTPGTIDCGYRNEIGVILINHSSSNLPFTILHGDRVAQMVLQKVPAIDWVEITSPDDFSDSERNKGGFGSTGK